MRAPLVALALLFTIQAAQASAVYTWINNPGTLGSATLTLSDDAYFAGGSSGQIRPYEGHIFYGTSMATLHQVDVSPLTVNVNVLPLYMYIGPPWNPATNGPPNSALYIDFSLTVVGDGLAGLLDYEDGYGRNYMDGTAAAWGNFEHTTDNNPMGCRANQVDGCDVLGGRWVLTSAPTPPTNTVPEPASAALLLGAIGGLSLLRRRLRP